MKLNWKDFLAVMIGLASAVGIYFMFNAEANIWLVKMVNNKPEALLQPAEILSRFNSAVLPSIQKYSLAMGAILLVVSISYILLGSQDDISTSPSEPDSKK